MITKNHAEAEKVGQNPIKPKRTKYGVSYSQWQKGTLPYYIQQKLKSKVNNKDIAKNDVSESANLFYKNMNELELATIVKSQSAPERLGTKMDGDNMVTADEKEEEK